MEAETTTEEKQEQELQTVSGAVEAVSQKGNRYGVLIAGDWYGGFGACPVPKGEVCVVDYVFNGPYRNVKRLRRVGEPTPTPAAGETPPPFPAAVRNYRTPEGWDQAFLTDEEERLIQAEVRVRNASLVAECIGDAKSLLGEGLNECLLTQRSVLNVALFLAERRAVHVSRVYDQFMAAKVAAMRRMPMGAEGESPSASASGRWA